jgi:hypothetical protein
MAEPREAGELRILGQLSPGQDLGTVTAKLAAEVAAPRLGVCTEPLPWYSGASPWGGAICNPGMIVTLMLRARQREGRRVHADDASVHEGVIAALGGVGAR